MTHERFGQADAIPSNLRLWHTPLWAPDVFAAHPLSGQLLYLCLLGHLAPSSHNTQPWRFCTDTSERLIHVCLDRSYVLRESDVQGRQAVISMGCAVEHVVLAARYYGARPMVETPDVVAESVRPLGDGDTQRYTLLTTVHLPSFDEPDDSSPVERLVRAIFTRKVVRAEFDPWAPVPPELVEALEQLSEDLGPRIHLVTGSHLGKRMLAELQGQADAYVINSPAFRRELGDWLLPNDTDSGVGMPGTGFGLDDVEARRIHEGLTGASVLRPDDGLRFALAGRRSIESAPVIGLVTVPRDEVRQWLNAGRMLGHALLLVDSAGLQSAIHAGIAEVPLVRRLFQVLGVRGLLATLFRVGYVKHPAHVHRSHSPRLPLEEVILDHRPEG